MKTTEQDIIDYCRKHGYDYSKLDLSDEDRSALSEETAQTKNGAQILDGFFSEARYEWRNAIIPETTD